MSEETELTETSNQQITLASNFSIQDFKSFYYLINAKPDRETFFYKESKIVSKEDLLELNDRIQEKLALHECVTNTVSIVVSLGNNRTVEFSNWPAFEHEKWNTSAITNSIVITWDVTIKLPAYKFPQRHTVKLRIGSRLKPKDFMELMWNHESDFEIHEAFAHAICTIDFINPVISNEIFLIVEKWHQGLSENFFPNKSFKFFKRHGSKIEKLFLLLTLAAGSLLLFGISKIYLSIIWPKQFDVQFHYRLFGGLLLCFLFMHCMYEVGKSWAARSTVLLDRLRVINIFSLTKGDSNANEKAKKRNQGIINQTISRLGITIIIGVIAYFSSSLYDFVINVITK